MQTVTETQLERRIDDFRAEVDRRFDASRRRFDDVDHRFEGSTSGSKESRLSSSGFGRT